MKKFIGIVDLSTGTIVDRTADTLTLDIPADLDRVTGGVSVDPQRIVRYFAAGGAGRLYVGRPSRLSRRVMGEECLVADEPVPDDGASCLRRYTLSVVDEMGAR